MKKTNDDRPRPFTDAEFNELRRNLTARGADGVDTIHAGAAKMFERLFATFDLLATLPPEGAGRVYTSMIDPGKDWIIVAVLVRSSKTGTLAIQQSRIRREVMLYGPKPLYFEELALVAADSIKQLLAAEGA